MFLARSVDFIYISFENILFAKILSNGFEFDIFIMKASDKEKKTFLRDTLDIEESNSTPLPQTLTFRTGEIAGRLLSIDHAMYFFSQKCGFYLPPRHVMSWHFISQLLAGEKMLIKATEVGSIAQIPRAKGVMIEDFWDEFKDSNKMHMFLPDFTPGMRVPREYFFNVSSPGAENHQSRVIHGNSKAAQPKEQRKEKRKGREGL